MLQEKELPLNTYQTIESEAGHESGSPIEHPNILSLPPFPCSCLGGIKTQQAFRVKQNEAILNK